MEPVSVGVESNEGLVGGLHHGGSQQESSITTKGKDCISPVNELRLEAVALEDLVPYMLLAVEVVDR